MHPVSIDQSRNKSKRREHTGGSRKILGCRQLTESPFPLPVKSPDMAGPGDRRVRRQHGNKNRGRGQEIGGWWVSRLGEEGATSVRRTRERSVWAILECDPFPPTHTTLHFIRVPGTCKSL